MKIRVFENAEAEFELIENRPSFGIKTLKQVHGVDGYRVGSDERDLKQGDWLWTTEVGCKIGVLVADCSAILISGPSRSYGNLVGAIHAGWRGTAKGIIASAISSLDLSHFRAWISPSICQEHFEVGAEVVRAFSDEYSEFAKEIGNGKFLFDLKAAQISELKKQGAEVFASSLCNFCQPEFVSYRRARGSLTERHLAWISRRS